MLLFKCLSIVYKPNEMEGEGDDSLKKEVEYCDQDVGVIHRKNK